MLVNMGTNATTSEDEKETGRIEVFSDGVFAIPITLLILDIKVPRAADLHGGKLGSALLAQWPSYLSYLTSFITVLIMWMNHHKLFRHILRSDHPFLVLNGLLLMVVTAVPFPTALIAEYMNRDQSRTAAAVYSGMFLVIAILFRLLWRYASHEHRLLSSRHDAEEVAAITRQYRFGPPLYLIAFLLAFLNVWASVGTCFALALFFALPGLAGKASGRGKGPRHSRFARKPVSEGKRNEAPSYIDHR
jgi:uncharacterized membrane protein